MAVRIDGKIYVTTSEACSITGSDKSLVNYWIYHGEFSGIIDMYDMEIFKGEESLSEDMRQRLESSRKKSQRNFFLIPLSQVVDKFQRLEKKRELIRSGKSSTKVENPLEVGNE